MITITIIFTFFYLKYLRRTILKYILRDKKRSIEYWLEIEATYIDIATFVVTFVLGVILAIVLIILVIKYLP